MIPPLMEPFISMVSMVKSKVHEEQQMNRYDSKADVILEQQLKAYYTLITDLWKYMKYYIDHLPTTDADWTAAIETGNRIAEKHPECQELATKLIVAVMDEIEKIAKFK